MRGDGPRITTRSGDTLVTSSFTLTQNGNPVSSQVLAAQFNGTITTNEQIDSGITANNAFLIPLAPLQLGGVTYTASFSGTVNGASVSKTWSFTTPPNVINATPAGPVTMKNGQSLAISFHAPSGLASWSYSTTLTTDDIQVVYLSSSELMLTVESTSITGPNTINFTISDQKLTGVPPQTIQITVTP